MVFEAIREFFNSGGIATYVTIGLILLLVVLTVILLIKKSIRDAAIQRLSNAFRKKGIDVIDERTEKKSFFGKYKEELPSEDSLRKIVEQLSDIVEKEKLLKEKERTFTREIEKLYSSAMEIGGIKGSRRPGRVIEKKAMSEDVKKVLTITDELLEKLPDDVIDRFVKSDNFKLYKKVIGEAKK